MIIPIIINIQFMHIYQNQYIKINTSYMTIIKHAHIYIKTVTYNRIKTFLQVALMPLKGFEHQTQRKIKIKTNNYRNPTAGSMQKHDI